MSVVIAAIAADAAALPTVQAGLLLAGVYRARLEVIHVGSPGPTLPHLGPQFADLPIRVLDGDVVDVVSHEMQREDVVAGAVGARSDVESAQPGGHIALGVATVADKPVALVPPDGKITVSGRLRVLVPLDGTEDSARTVRAVIRRVTDADVEVIVLHVFDPATAPRFLDHAEHDLPVWSHEFLTRHCDEPGCRMVWRTGRPGGSIADAATAEHVNGVILGWNGVLEPGRAKVVREVLARAAVPVLLVPRSAAERTLASAEPSSVA